MITGFQRTIYKIAHETPFFEELFEELISPSPKKTKIFDIIVKNFYHFNLLEYCKVNLKDLISLQLISVPYWNIENVERYHRYTTHFNFDASAYREIKGSDAEDRIRQAWIKKSKSLAKSWAES